MEEQAQPLPWNEGREEGMEMRSPAEYYGKEDYHDDFDSSSSLPLLSNNLPNKPSKRGRKIKFLVLLRNRLFLFSMLTLISTMGLSIYFDTPSTLWVYLTFVFAILPLSVIWDATAYLVSKGKEWWTKSRKLWILVEIPSLLALLALNLVLSQPFGSRISSSSFSSLQENQTYFIAANLYNNEAILRRFTSTLVDLTESLGKENVFISIYESNSKDRTKDLLADFDQQLNNQGIKHKIQSENFGHHFDGDANGRIKFLASVRNKAQEAFYGSPLNQKFDRVIWFNDVVFEKEEILELINTNRGDYDQVCGIDVMWVKSEYAI